MSKLEEPSTWLTKEEKEWIVSLLDFTWIGRRAYVALVQSHKTDITKHQVFGVIKNALKSKEIEERKVFGDLRTREYRMLKYE